MPDTRAPRRWSSDVWAVLLLVALPVVVFATPALLGHAVLPGDDLTQNFPLRVLAGQQIHAGHLPLYDPYIWSGAPLLGDWNAGAAYPLTFLFAVLPPVAAWTLNMVVTWAVAGTGTFLLLRALRLASLPSCLGALSFAFAGAMSAQVAHFGLVAGMSWAPVALLSVLRLTQPRGAASRARWTGVLAAAMGLAILAGEPRAIDDTCVIVVIYAAWRIARLGRGRAQAVLAIAAGLALGACLGAVQWMPGLAAVGASQRGASSVVLFDSGSLPHRWLLLMLVPDLLGGSGSFGQPGFFANYNLAEVTGYVGILPLVAAAALLGRVRRRPRLPEWIVWHVVALVGVVLALGGNTPAGALLAHLPLFGGQRLQSRNILVTDLALAVLLAYWADRPLAGEGRRVPGNRRVDLETVLGVLPPLAVIAVVVAGFSWGAGFLHWLRAGHSAAAVAGPLKPWLVPYALIGAAAMAFVIFGRRLPTRPRSRWLGSLIGIDLVLFTLLAVVAVRPGPGGGVDAAAARGQHRPAGPALARHHEGGTPPQAPAPRPIAALGYRGRFAIYDPDELDAHELPILGAPDLNAVSATPSVQGYSSTVGALYARETGSHLAMGEGQNVLSPTAVGNGVLDQLDTSVLLTPPAYVITPAGASSPSPGPPGTGRRDIAADHRATWYFATQLDVSRLAAPDPNASRDAAAGARIGLVTPGGATRWFPARAANPSLLAVNLPRPVASVAAIGVAGSEPCRLGPPSVTEPNGAVFTADGQLQDALTPPRWEYAGHDGSFAVFADRFARGPLSLQALPGRSTSSASVRRVAGPVAQPTAAEVRSPHGVRVIRSVAAAAGWSATWHPRLGRTTTLAVRRAGLVQGVAVPPGQGVLTWTYEPPWFTAGFALSLGAAALILLLLIGPSGAAGRRAGPQRGARRNVPVRATAAAAPASRVCETAGPHGRDSWA